MSLQIILLTHEREVDRPTNTGRLALEMYPDTCRRIVWSRVAPDPLLMGITKQPDTWLLFPADDTVMVEVNNSTSDFYSNNQSIQVIILDATWQEARKMYRQSPYLNQIKRLNFTSVANSQYALRRNQVAGGLCTVECVAQLMSDAGRTADSEQLTQALAMMPTQRAKA
ncbi:DTW domain-containing protein [Shewanella sp. Scap07]|uniref:tRNA-uridine aminocarboxypropyltransferase n=1 Tax=Shewanella sp. Scap07 TaxID=2589987 RepID=UPI0015BA8B45|nr:tRNA-uridine aminocarboxypropyltransferase [Shewanella sp. Scap07]QLE85697.1 DTW domain-containing protein [Shewanella sp. Scap07]